jgi:hypothetical protein
MHAILLIGKNLFENLLYEFLICARVKIYELARLYLDRSRLHLEPTCYGRCIEVRGTVFKFLDMDRQTPVIVPAGVLLTRGDGILWDGVPELNRIRKVALVFAEKSREKNVLFVFVHTLGRQFTRFGKANIHGIAPYPNLLPSRPIRPFRIF